MTAVNMYNVDRLSAWYLGVHCKEATWLGVSCVKCKMRRNLHNWAPPEVKVSFFSNLTIIVIIAL